MPPEKDDLVLRPGWCARVALLNFAFKFHPTVIAIVF